MVIIQVLDALFQLVVLHALLDADQEEIIVGIQGELVHGVHTSQVIQHKVQDGCPDTAGLVGGSSSLNLLGCGLSYLKTKDMLLYSCHLLNRSHQWRRMIAWYLACIPSKGHRHLL